MPPKENIEYYLPFQPSLPQFSLMHKIYDVMRYNYIVWCSELKVNQQISQIQVKDLLNQMVMKHQELTDDPSFSTVMERVQVGFRINFHCGSNCTKETIESFLRICSKCDELDYIGFTVSSQKMIYFLKDILNSYGKISISKSTTKSNSNQTNQSNQVNKNINTKLNEPKSLVNVNTNTEVKTSIPENNETDTIVIINLSKFQEDIKFLSFYKDLDGFKNNVHFEFLYSDLGEKCSSYRELFGRSKIPKDLILWSNGTLDWKSTLSPEERSCKLSVLFHQKNHKPRPFLSGRFIKNDINKRRERRKAVFNPEKFVPLFGNKNSEVSILDQFILDLTEQSTKEEAIEFIKSGKKRKQSSIESIESKRIKIDDK